jgi:hypothetical protein
VYEVTTIMLPRPGIRSEFPSARVRYSADRVLLSGPFFTAGGQNTASNRNHFYLNSKILFTKRA